jgi:GMP synthase (glutamine-hydrolysing)
MAYLASEIPANFRGLVNRVVYALGHRALFDWSVTRTRLDRATRTQLRQADRIVTDVMRSFDALTHIKQMPVILLPLSFAEPGERSIVLRPVATSTFMTVQPMLPDRDLPAAFFSSITDRLLSEVPGISQVFLDLTNKPPGTTEWE